MAQANPRDDMKMAYIDAAAQLDNLEIDAAIGTLDQAIANAKAQGLGEDPALAPLHAMRGGLIYSASGDREATIEALVEAVELDYNVTLPIELRSAELQALLDEARTRVQKPAGGAVIHDPPAAPVPSEPLELGALVNQPLPDGAQVVLYWRTEGTADYQSAYMDVWGNFATATITPDQHGGKPIEYFFYVFDAQQQSLANSGDQQNPMRIEFTGAAAAPPDDEKEEDEEETEKPRQAKSSRDIGLPRFFINLGVGTSVGIARGTAELTYQQFDPAVPTSVYGLREQACAIERWQAGGLPLANSQQEFNRNINEVNASVPEALPPGVTPEQLSAAYNAEFCKRRHPVQTGLASAPFHIAPEFGVRVSDRIVLSVYGRLQVVTATNIESEDPNKSLAQSFAQDVRPGACSPTNPDACPAGFGRKPPFTWAVGAKFKYFFGKPDRKFRFFVGGFAGYGNARLRVPMGFANDRNGNSVPDTAEVVATGPRNPDGSINIDGCVPVWPYNGACDPATTSAERSIAEGIQASTSASDQRVDSVRIGPGFVGGLLGFHIQIVEHFGWYGEVDIGAWFPNTSSGLLDLNTGPSITF